MAIVWTAAAAAGATMGQQTPAAIASPEDVVALLQSADQLLRAKQYADALGSFERVVEEARRLGLPQQEAQALCGLAEIHLNRARYAEVRGHAAGCGEIYERLAGAAGSPVPEALNRGIGRSNYVLSILAGREGNAKEGQERAERAIAAYDAAGDRRGRALATLQLIRVADLGPDERVLRERLIDDARAVSDRFVEGQAEHLYGDYLFTTGDYAGALTHLEAAAALFEATGRQVDLGTTYNSLGRLYRAHGRLDAALTSQLKALAIHERADSPFTYLQSLNAVAVTYASLGDSRRAIGYFERALGLAEQVSTPKIRDFLRANFASTLLEEGEYQRATDILAGVVARGLDSYPSIRMRELAYGFIRLGRPEIAMSWARKAVDACGSRESDCIWARSRRAEAYAALGDDDAALADLQAAMKSIETMRARLVPEDFFKQQFHLAKEELYGRAIAIQVRRGQAAEALETAERARARAFVDLLASRHLSLDETDTVPRGAAGSGTRSPESALPLVLRGGGLGGSSAWRPGTDLLSETATPAATSADMAASAARLRSTLLAYWVTPTRIFIWVVRPDGAVHSAHVDVTVSRLLELIRATAPFVDGTRQAPERQVTTRGAAAVTLATPAPAPWRELYDRLIKPVRAALPRTPGALLTIIPHGPLGAVAFAGLQDGRGRYLLEDYTLHYAPSGTALQFTAAKRRGDSRTGSILLVADPAPPRLSNLDRPLPRLPGARAEGRAIAGLVPAARLARFEGNAAHESAVRTASAGKAVLHFATHAIVRDDDPFSSFLALAPVEPDGDGLLTAQEIYRLRLDADLVVLSACRTAGGRVTGDGIATFARAFIYAGAPSIVASLWDVADEPTNRLIPLFYRSWLGGASKARALRTAQLRLLDELRRGALRIETPAGLVSLPEHPLFWAGFSLIGEPY